MRGGEQRPSDEIRLLKIGRASSNAHRIEKAILRKENRVLNETEKSSQKKVKFLSQEAKSSPVTLLTI